LPSAGNKLDSVEPPYTPKSGVRRNAGNAAMLVAAGMHTTPKQPMVDAEYTTCCAVATVHKHRLANAAPTILNSVPRAAIASSDMNALKELVRGTRTTPHAICRPELLTGGSRGEYPRARLADRNRSRSKTTLSRAA